MELPPVNSYGVSQTQNVASDIIKFNKIIREFIDSGCQTPKYTWYQKLYYTGLSLCNKLIRLTI